MTSTTIETLYEWNHAAKFRPILKWAVFCCFERLRLFPHSYTDGHRVAATFGYSDKIARNADVQLPDGIPDVNYLKYTLE